MSKLTCLLTLLTCGACLLFQITVTAQIGGSRTTTATAAPAIGDQLILRALDSCLLIIQVDYVLRENKKKDPQDFGKDTLDYFGRGHGLAVVSDGSYWFDPHLLYPWLYEDADNYNEVKDEEHYKPVVSAIRFRNLNGKQFSAYTFASDSLPKFSKALTSMPVTDPNMPVGLPQREPGKDTTGLVLLLPNGTFRALATSDTASANPTVHAGGLDFSDAQKSLYRTPLLSRLRPPDSGILLHTEANAGRLNFYFSGILYLVKGGDLELLPTTYSSALPKPVETSKPVLKPIERSKQTPKGNSKKDDKSKGKKK